MRKHIATIVALAAVGATAACADPLSVGSGPDVRPDREPDAVGTLSETWVAGSGGPVVIDAERAAWGLASDDESWDGAELGIKRVPVEGVENSDATVFMDGDGRVIDDPSDRLYDGQAVRVWCDAVATSLPPICSVSHLEFSEMLEG